jgi:hypothetical protein
MKLNEDWCLRCEKEIAGQKFYKHLGGNLRQGPFCQKCYPNVFEWVSKFLQEVLLPDNTDGHPVDMVDLIDDPLGSETDTAMPGFKPTDAKGLNDKKKNEATGPFNPTIGRDPMWITCPECGEMWDPSQDGSDCPSCGYMPEAKNESVNEGRGECQCVDPGCPVNHYNRKCNRPAEHTLYRIDMDDDTGTQMCTDCADDAEEAGVFRESQLESMIGMWTPKGLFTEEVPDDEEGDEE